MSVKADEICWMSWITPKISLVRMLPLIARMSVKLSEASLSCLYPSVAAVRRADRSARASAISGELTKSMEIEFDLGSFASGPEKIQASPACRFSLSQAASVWQMIRYSPPCCQALTQWRSGKGLFFKTFLWLLQLHSLARANPFVATSIGERLLFSKTKRLRPLHNDQQIHGKTWKIIPEGGGRQVDFLKKVRICLKLLSVLGSIWTVWDNGTHCQTSRAKEHVKKVCTADSLSLHLGQLLVWSICNLRIEI